MEFSTRVATTAEEASICVELLRNDDEHVLGFDTESTGDRVSVIQLCNSRVCFIFQVSRIVHAGGVFPSGLKSILESPHFIKTGVASEMDAERLRKSGYNLEPRGILDVQHLAIGACLVSSSLSDLSWYWLRVPDAKGGLSHEGDWNADLSEQQVRYGALDAHHSLRLGLYVLNAVKGGGKVAEVRETGESWIAELSQRSEFQEEMARWLMGALLGSKRDRSLASVLNQASNSFAPLVRMCKRGDRKQVAHETILALVANNALPVPYDSDLQVFPATPVVADKEGDNEQLRLLREIHQHIQCIPQIIMQQLSAANHE